MCNLSRQGFPGVGFACGRWISRRGFTLIELLVVVVIIAILIAIILPSLSRARARSQFVSCKAHIKSVVQAHAIYRHDFADIKPPLYHKKVVSTRFDWVSPDIRWDSLPVGQGILVQSGYIPIGSLLDPSEAMRDDAQRDLANWNAISVSSGGSSYAYYWREPMVPSSALGDAPRLASYTQAENDGRSALLMDINAEQGIPYVGEYAGRPWLSHPMIKRVNVGYISGTVEDFPSTDIVLKYPGQTAEELAWFAAAHKAAK